MIETGFGKEFSEPPNVTVSAARTHCEACKEPLDPNVMHNCHGNKEWKPTHVAIVETGDTPETRIRPELRPAVHPDLTNYKGVCPAVHVEGEICDWCENTGTIPPTKGDAP